MLAAISAISVWTTTAAGEWRDFTADQGFIGGTALCMLEDTSETLWFGTTRGVSHYDGIWHTLTVADGLAGNYIHSIAEDRSGYLWFATDTGLSRHKGSTWQTFTTGEGLAGNHVLSILQDRLGNLWFGTTTGVSRYDGSAWRTFTTADGLAGDNVGSLLEDRSGSLWFGTYGSGVARWDGTTWRTFTVADGLGSNYVTTLAEDMAGNVWVGMEDGGLSRYDGSSWLSFTSELGSHDVSSLLVDHRGNLWVGSNLGGVARYDGSNWRSYNTSNGLASFGVWSILEDRSGNLWFGTSSGGLSRYDGSAWSTFTTATTGNGLGSNSIVSMLEDRSGSLWFGTQASGFTGAGAGLTRYDGRVWRAFTATDGLTNGSVYAILEDHLGNLWFGTLTLYGEGGGGVSRYDGSTWRTFTTADGLGSNRVISMLEDRSGNIWFGTQAAFGEGAAGVTLYDGSTWRVFTTADGLATGNVRSILEDRSGNLWFATDAGGVTRYDGSTWRTFTTTDGLASDVVSCMLEDRLGNLWFGGGGLTRYDGSTWRVFTVDDGLVSNGVLSMVEDRSGNLWFGTRAGFGEGSGGISRYDGNGWLKFTEASGLAGGNIQSMMEDRSGNLWFGTDRAGLSRHEPDRVPPQTTFLNAPPPLSPARDHAAAFAPFFDEGSQTEFSFRQDAGPWSTWSPSRLWFSTNLPDGVHTLETRCRDLSGNIDPTPAMVEFEVDATPPAPVIASPQFGKAVQGRVEVVGSAADVRFLSYLLEVRPQGAASWESVTESSAQVSDGLIATWESGSLADGNYDLRLVVTDSLGLTGAAQVTVIVDNHFPFAGETAPAAVTSDKGGDLYTTNQELHLYFPPRAFDEDALVSIDPSASVPDTLPSGAIRVLSGYTISWGSKPLRKPATLELSTAGAALASAPLAIYSSPDGSAWRRLGGTLEQSKLSIAVLEAGRYALFAEVAPPAGGASTLSSLSFAPRVFSPTGAYADREVGIGFTLGRTAPVTVRIYARNGRLIRDVLVGETLGAGANLVRWDGRDRNGGYVTDGIYLVTVKALGRTEAKPLAVVK